MSDEGGQDANGGGTPAGDTGGSGEPTTTPTVGESQDSGEWTHPNMGTIDTRGGEPGDVRILSRDEPSTKR